MRPFRSYKPRLQDRRHTRCDGGCSLCRCRALARPDPGPGRFYRTLISSACVTLCPAASCAVSVYVVVFVGFTSTHRLYDGHTGLSCGTSVTTFALATP